MNRFKVSIHEITENRFTVSFIHPLNKRRTRKTFAKREDAKRYKAEFEAKFKKSAPISYRESTIEELMIQFMQNVSSNPFATIKSINLIDFYETFKDCKLSELTSTKLKEWLDLIQRENKLKDISMRGLKCEVDTFFTFLEKQEIISESPLSTILYKNSAPPLKSRNILTQKQIYKLLEAIKGYSPGYLYPIIKLLSETAIKSSELIELTWRQVNLNDGTLTLAKRSKIQGRTLNLSDELTNLLKQREKRFERVFTTYYKENFTNHKLRCLTSEFKEKKLCNIEWTINDLRHSHAVNFLTSGGEIKELQRVLGHKSSQDTKRLYDEVAKAKITSEIITPF